MTAEDIERLRTPNGGWTKAQLAQWGVPWPPPKGWKRELIAPIEAGTAETSGSAQRARAGSAPDNGEQWVIEDA